MTDNVNHPTHYADSCSIECIDAMLLIFGYEDTINYCIINAFKYIWRHKNKNGLEDLKKAEWYVNKAEELYKEFYDFKDEEAWINVNDQHEVLRKLIQEGMNEYIEEELPKPKKKETDDGEEWLL